MGLRRPVFWFGDVQRSLNIFFPSVLNDLFVPKRTDQVLRGLFETSSIPPVFFVKERPCLGLVGQDTIQVCVELHSIVSFCKKKGDKYE